MKTTLVTEQMDGTERRYWKRRNKRYVCCDGKHDADILQDAIDTEARGKTYSIPGILYDRIFRRH